MYNRQIKELPYTVRLGLKFWMGDNHVKEWVQTHCTGDYTVTIAWIAFEKEEDAMFFTLSHNI